MIDENIEENLFSMLDEETDSEYVVLFVYMMYPTVTNTSSLRYIYIYTVSIWYFYSQYLYIMKVYFVMNLVIPIICELSL